MQRQLTLAVALVALVAVNVASAFGPYGAWDGLNSAVPAAASVVDANRAVNHAAAAENRATEAMIDRATGNPIGAAINENRAIGHSVASNVAATKSNVEASIATSNMGATAALGAPGVGLGPAAAGISGLRGYPAGGYGLYPGAAYGYGGYPLGYGGPYGYGPFPYAAGTSRALANGAAGAALANGIAGPALGSAGAALGVSY